MYLDRVQVRSSVQDEGLAAAARGTRPMAATSTLELDRYEPTVRSSSGEARFLLQPCIGFMFNLEKVIDSNYHVGVLGISQLHVYMDFEIGFAKCEVAKHWFAINRISTGAWSVLLHFQKQRPSWTERCLSFFFLCYIQPICATESAQIKFPFSTYFIQSVYTVI